MQLVPKRDKEMQSESPQTAIVVTTGGLSYYLVVLTGVVFIVR